ncbi:ATP-binding protein [Acholeplasma sp. OttesenSCG-928-E16]|nr:ATP-binding protein [Acholeplasma sp. OttesenSCG-928-E16]
MYYKRHIEEVIMKMKRQFKTVLITGPRQVGKTTVLKHLFNDTYNYVTFDDYNFLNLAKNDPQLFMKEFESNTIFDEIQYVPTLFSTLKLVVDRNSENGRYLMTGSQAFNLMKDVSESLAGRVGIIELHGLSMREKKGISFNLPFIPTKDYIETRKDELKREDDVWFHIHRGSLPVLMDYSYDWEQVYSSYLKTYIERDIRDVLNISDELVFSKFIVSVAARSGQLLNYSSIANDIGVSVPTVKKWISVLKSSGIIYLLEPYHNNLLTRIVKTPKLYLLDTGFLAFLTRWMTPEVLKFGAQAGHVFETFVVSEIIKSYTNAGKSVLPLYYYRDIDGKEIDLIIEENGILYPIEIKMTASPTLKMASSFKTLDKIATHKKGQGCIICLADNKLSLSEEVIVLPVEYI